MADYTTILGTSSGSVGSDAMVTGYKCFVYAGNSDNDLKPIGFVDSMRATKSLQLQRAQVCGAIMPASIDPQSYQITISMSGFIARPKAYKELTGADKLNGSGYSSDTEAHSIAEFNPDQSSFIEGQLSMKFPVIKFIDKKDGDLVIASFKNVMVSSYNVTVQGGTYVKADVQMEALEMSSGTDYLSQNS